MSDAAPGKRPPKPKAKAPQRRKKVPQTRVQRAEALLDLAAKRAAQNSTYTMEQARTCAMVASALIDLERLHRETTHA